MQFACNLRPFRLHANYLQFHFAAQNELKQAGVTECVYMSVQERERERSVGVAVGERGRGGFNRQRQQQRQIN